MLTLTQTVGTVISSASSSHSSGSQTSFSNDTGGSYGGNHIEPSDTMLGVRPGSMARIRLISNPADYLLPGASPNAHVLYAIAGARIYHSTQLSGFHKRTLSFGRSQNSKAKKGGSQWVYSHLKGTLVFGRDRYGPGFEAATVDEIVASSRKEGGEPSGEWWFQLADDEAGKILWKFKLPIGPGSKFCYELDRPFFHVFQGSSRKYGFLFDDDKESVIFSGEVNSHTTAAMATISKPPKGRPRSLNIKSSKKTKHRESSMSYPTSAGISGTNISPPIPHSFKHIAHIGLNRNSGAIETSKNLDPAFLADLQTRMSSNVTKPVVLEHLDFIQGYWRDLSTIQSTSSRPVAAS